MTSSDPHLTCLPHEGNLSFMKNTLRTGRSLAQRPRFVKTEKVLILLIKKRISQVELARRWGVSRSAVSALVSGKVPYSPLLLRLAEVLSVPLRSISTGNMPNLSKD